MRSKGAMCRTLCVLWRGGWSHHQGATTVEPPPWSYHQGATTTELPPRSHHHGATTKEHHQAQKTFWASTGPDSSRCQRSPPPAQIPPYHSNCTSADSPHYWKCCRNHRKWVYGSKNQSGKESPGLPPCLVDTKQLPDMKGCLGENNALHSLFIFLVLSFFFFFQKNPKNPIPGQWSPPKRPPSVCATHNPTSFPDIHFSSSIAGHPRPQIASWHYLSPEEGSACTFFDTG